MLRDVLRMEQFLKPGDQLGIWSNEPQGPQRGLRHVWDLIWKELGREVLGSELENLRKGINKVLGCCQGPHL